VKKVIRTIYMPRLPFFTAHNTIPNDKNTDDSQMQNPHSNEVNLLFYLGYLCMFENKRMLDVAWGWVDGEIAAHRRGG
jgi:hypothetical protein